MGMVGESNPTSNPLVVLMRKKHYDGRKLVDIGKLLTDEEVNALAADVAHETTIQYDWSQLDPGLREELERIARIMREDHATDSGVNYTDLVSAAFGAKIATGHVGLFEITEFSQETGSRKRTEPRSMISYPVSGFDIPDFLSENTRDFFLGQEIGSRVLQALEEKHGKALLNPEHRQMATSYFAHQLNGITVEPSQLAIEVAHHHIAYR